MKLDCCLSDFRLFTPGNGSRKQNIFSSNYTYSSWIIRFGYALFYVRDPIPIFDALVVLASSQYGGTKAGCRDRCFFSWRFGNLGGSLCIRGQNEKSFLPKVTTFLPWKLVAFGDVKKRDCITVNLQFRSKAPNFQSLPVFCCFLHFFTNAKVKGPQEMPMITFNLPVSFFSFSSASE